MAAEALTSPASSEPLRPRTVVLYALALAAAAIVLHPDTWFGGTFTDMSAWLYMGGRMNHGAVPYRDLWDNKLPPIYLICSVAMKTGAPRMFLGALDVIATTIAALATAWMVLPVAGRRVAAVTGLVLVLLTGHPVFHRGGGTTECFSLPFSAAAIALVLSAQDGRRVTLKGFAAGLCLALAAGFRTPTVFAAAAFLPPLASMLFAKRYRDVGLGVAGACAGGALGVALVLAHPLLNGYFKDMYELCITWNSNYAKVTPSGAPGDPGGRFGPINAKTLFGFWAFAGIALVATVSAARRSPLRTSLFLWFLAAFLQTKVGGHDHIFHHYVTFAPLAALAVLGALDAAEWLRARGLPSWAPNLVFALAGAAFVGTVLPAQLPFWLAAARDRTLDPAPEGCHETVAYVRARTAPDEVVFAWPEGQISEMFWRLDRPAPSRHYFPFAYLGLGCHDADLDIWAQQLMAAKPRYAVLTYSLQEYWDHGALPKEQDAPPIRDVAAFLRAEYVEDARFGVCVVIRRKG